MTQLMGADPEAKGPAGLHKSVSSVGGGSYPPVRGQATTRRENRPDGQSCTQGTSLRLAQVAADPAHRGPSTPRGLCSERDAAFDRNEALIEAGEKFRAQARVWKPR